MAQHSVMAFRKGENSLDHSNTSFKQLCIEGYQEKLAQLERKVGQLTMENDVLKKVLKQTQSQRARSAPIYPITLPHSEASGGAAPDRQQRVVFQGLYPPSRGGDFSKPCAL